MRIFEYPATLVPDQEAGGFVVTFRDFPEAITQGEDVQDALSQAADALDEAVANRMALNLELPTPSEPDDDAYSIPVPAPTAIKAALYSTFREHGLSNVQLAADLCVDEKEIRRLLDPYHRSRLTRVQKILRQLGKRLIVAFEDVAPVAQRPHSQALEWTFGYGPELGPGRWPPVSVGNLYREFPASGALAQEQHTVRQENSSEQLVA